MTVLECGRIEEHANEGSIEQETWSIERICSLASPGIERGDFTCAAASLRHSHVVRRAH
jgi:hypothetical protein